MLMTEEKIKITFVYQPPVEWRCKNCGELLGYIVDQNHNEYLDMVTTRGIKLLGSADVHCLCCGGVREWHPGDAKLDRLISKVVKGNRKNTA